MEEGGTEGWRDGEPAAAASSSFAARSAARCCFPPAQLPLPVSPRTPRALRRAPLPCGTCIPQPATLLSALPLLCPPSHALPSAAPAWDGPSAPPSNPWACGCSHLHRCVPHPWVQGTRLGPETVPEHPGLVLDLVLLWFLSPRVWYPDSQTQSPGLVPIQNRSDPGCFSAWS